MSTVESHLNYKVYFVAIRKLFKNGNEIFLTVETNGKVCIVPSNKDRDVLSPIGYKLSISINTSGYIPYSYK